MFTADKELNQKIFIANALIFLVTNFSRQIYAPMLLTIEQAFDINHALSGFLITLSYIGYAFFRFPSGLLSAYLGQIPVILFSGCLLIIALILAYISNSYYILALATFILGCTTGLYVTAGYSLGTLIGGERKVGRSTGLLESFGTLGSIIAPFVVTLTFIWFSWREVFLLVTIFLIIALFFFYSATSRTGYQHLSRSLFANMFNRLWSEQLRPFILELRNDTLRNFLLWATIVGGIEGIAWIGYLYFIPTYLVEVKGFSLAISNNLYLIAFIVALFTKTYIGILADKFGNLQILFLSISISFFASLIFTMVETYWSIIFLLTIMGTFMLSLNTIINSYVLKELNGKFQAIGFGFFGSLYTVIYSIGPSITGVIAEKYSLQIAMQVMPFIFLLVIPLIIKPIILERAIIKNT